MLHIVFSTAACFLFSSIGGNCAVLTGEVKSDGESILRREASNHAQAEIFEDVLKERDRLREEVVSLKRKLYLAEVRQDSCIMHGFIGNGGDYAQRWGCYPASMRAKYCMANEASQWGQSLEGDCKNTMYANSSYAEFARYEWHPPENPNKKVVQTEPLVLTQVSAPFEPTQFSDGVYGMMRMTHKAEVYWDWPVLAFLAEMHRNKGDVSPSAYPKAQLNMQGAIDAIGGVQGKTVLVVGSISPWLESIALHNGASQVTTVDYNMPLLDPEVRAKEPRLLPRQMTELLASGDTFDVILSYSSIEHDGLGRYGDPLNPDGDLASQKEVFLMLQPKGKYVLGTLGGQMDGLWYVSQRGYGPLRMPILARGWKYENAIEDGKVAKRFALHGMPHNVMIFTKPNPTAFALEETYEEEGCALKCSPAVLNGKQAECFPSDKNGIPC